MCRCKALIRLGIFVFPGWLHSAAAVVDHQPSPPYHNVMLRQYFQGRLLGTTSDWPKLESAGSAAPDPDVERKVDLLIADFTERLIERLATVNYRLAQMESERRRLIPGLRSGDPSSLWRLRIRLNELRKAVAELRQHLAPVFPQETSTCGFRPSVADSDLGEGFEKQAALLRAELERGQRLIRDLIIEPTFTVSVNDLRGHGMLVSLHRAERIAEAMMSFLTRKGTSAGSRRR